MKWDPIECSLYCTLKNVLYWPEDDRLQSKHVAIMWSECIYNITLLIYSCVLTVYNTLYKFKSVDWHKIKILWVIRLSEHFFLTENGAGDGSPWINQFCSALPREINKKSRFLARAQTDVIKKTLEYLPCITVLTVAGSVITKLHTNDFPSIWPRYLKEVIFSSLKYLVRVELTSWSLSLEAKSSLRSHFLPHGATAPPWATAFSLSRLQYHTQTSHTR